MRKEVSDEYSAERKALLKALLKESCQSANIIGHQSISVVVRHTGNQGSSSRR